ncbi:uncharacterized protein LOC117314895 [Pecten maximus]|uniref:uncharacterized protein LOC117314895 n=1 Tax=Pecten maximus TaxID=6579 RepID=UPI001458B194|nr:uncharacterized protein LOC117314895 [Pecten maximus]
MKVSLTSLQLREPLTSLLVLCIMTWTLTLCTARGPICMKCQNITNNGNCSNITRCNDGEGCYAREVITATGSAVLQTGCLAHQLCTILESTAVGIGRRDNTGEIRKRDVTSCYRCCEKDLCNEHICDVVLPTSPISTQPPNSLVTTPTPGKQVTCFICSDATNVTDCTTTSTCAVGQQCYTTRASLAGNIHYSMGCEESNICPHYSTVPSAQSPFCKRCCDSDRCNIKLCGLHLIPELVTKPVNRTLEVDDVTRLRCEADQASNATLSWMFESPSGSTVLPKPVAFGKGNTTAFFQITPQHFGKWTCIATNSFGNSSASAYITHLSST